MRWTITWAGITWTEDDLTVGHVADIIRASGRDEWESMNPAQSPTRLIYILAAFIAGSTDADVTVVLKELVAVKFATVLETLGLIVDED